MRQEAPGTTHSPHISGSRAKPQDRDDPILSSGRNPQVWLINGIPGAGKTTTAGALARSYPRGAHIEGEKLQEMIVSGAVWPGEAPVEEEHRQIDLCVRNQGLIAASFASAGFVTVIDYVITSRRRVDQYLDCLPNTRVHLVTLDPGILVALERDRRRPEKTVAQFWTHLENEIRRELSGTGLWIDNSTLHIEEIVQLIREQAPQSIVN